MTVKERKVRFIIIKDSNSEMISHKNDFLFSEKLTPVRQHQAYEEMLDIEKRFAGEIYYARCLDKRL